MSDQEREQQDEKSPEEREETLKDLDVSEEDSKDVQGGAHSKLSPMKD